MTRSPPRKTLIAHCPTLIVENNLHGVDIDPRAAQIAALALWLRAQRAWQEAGIEAADRPAINRTGIVIAEPMPGDADMLSEFAAGLDPPLLQSSLPPDCGEHVARWRDGYAASPRG